MKNFILCIVCLLTFIGCSSVKTKEQYIRKYEPLDLNTLKFKGTSTYVDDNKCSETFYIFHIRKNKLADVAKDITMTESCEIVGKVLTNCKCSYSSAIFDYEFLKDSTERLSLIKIYNLETSK